MRDALKKIGAEIQRPYPESAFAELTKAEWAVVHNALRDTGVSLDRVSASNMRHVGKIVAEAPERFREALTSEPEKVEPLMYVHGVGLATREYLFGPRPPESAGVSDQRCTCEHRDDERGLSGQWNPDCPQHREGEPAAESDMREALEVAEAWLHEDRHSARSTFKAMKGLRDIVSRLALTDALLEPTTEDGPGEPVSLTVLDEISRRATVVADLSKEGQTGIRIRSAIESLRDYLFRHPPTQPEPTDD